MSMRRSSNAITAPASVASLLEADIEGRSGALNSGSLTSGAFTEGKATEEEGLGAVDGMSDFLDLAGGVGFFSGMEGLVPPMSFFLLVVGLGSGARLGVFAFGGGGGVGVVFFTGGAGGGLVWRVRKMKRTQ